MTDNPFRPCDKEDCFFYSEWDIGIDSSIRGTSVKVCGERDFLTCLSCEHFVKLDNYYTRENITTRFIGVT